MPDNMFKRLWFARAIFMRSVSSDIKAQYAGTVFGLAWVWLGPAVLLSLYAVIYIVIFQVRVPNFTVQEYVLNVFSGLAPFLAFAQGLSASTQALSRSQGLLFNSSFPDEYIPAKAVVVAYVVLPAGLVLTFIGDIAVSSVSWTWLLVPVVVILQILFSIGVAFFISLISLVFRDMQLLVQYIMIALLVVTPIAYTPDMIPAQLLPLLYVNPLFYFVYFYQHLILLNQLPPLEIMVAAVVSSVATFSLGLLFFSRARRALSDLI